jgi:hypothetical protein
MVQFFMLRTRLRTCQGIAPSKRQRTFTQNINEQPRIKFNRMGWTGRGVTR